MQSQAQLYGAALAPGPPLTDEEALHAFWKLRGVQLEGQRNALVAMGTTLASNVVERSLYRDTTGARKRGKRAQASHAQG